MGDTRSLVISLPGQMTDEHFDSVKKYTQMRLKYNFLITFIIIVLRQNRYRILSETTFSNLLVIVEEKILMRFLTIYRFKAVTLSVRR